MVYWPAELIGIEGRDIGITVPTFEDMFNSLFVDDVFCTYSYSSQIDGENWLFNYDWMRYEITALNYYEDSLVLEANYFQKTTDHEYGYFCDYYQGDTILKFYPNGYTESYPNQPILIDGYDIYSIADIEHYKFGGISKTNKKFSNPEWVSYSLFSQDYEYPEILSPVYYESLQFIYSDKFGFMELFNEGFEWSAIDTIVGYLHNDDTLGIIFSENMFVGTNQLSTNSNSLIYPNPAKDFITIQSPTKNEDIAYKIYNLNGILLKEGELNQKESRISVKELPKGMYFIEIYINGEKSTQKWIKN